MGLPAERQDLGSSPERSKRPSWELFDEQATAFEQRAGLPAEHCRDIATTVVEIGRMAPDDLIVEVGPGTGQIAQWFQESFRYVGFDLSSGMLGESRRRLGREVGNRSLIQADANARWPLANGRARVVFSSRALHLIDHEHVADEVFRVGRSDGATLIFGRVERQRDSVRARMAREMNERLRRHGFEGRRGEQQNPKLVESCRRRGATALELRQVASWNVSTSPRQSLDSWRCLTGLGGIRVPPPAREEILNDLEAWAEEEFGGLDREFEAEETYVLRFLRTPVAQELITTLIPS